MRVNWYVAFSRVSPMFEDYTTQQLVELRHLCAETARRSHDIEQIADALLIMECIEEELVVRGQSKAAA
jgi:hypothetical protein